MTPGKIIPEVVFFLGKILLLNLGHSAGHAMGNRSEY